jgi:magnesium-transporting ATPase (P-type)
MDRADQNLWLPSVVGRMCIFLFFFSFLVLSLFLLGNFQNFLDSTLIVLLRMFEISSLLYVVAALYYGVLRIVPAVRKTVPWKTIPVVLSLVGAAFLFALYLFFGFLLAWLKPLN